MTTRATCPFAHFQLCLLFVFVLEFVDLSHHTIAIPLHCHYYLHTTSHHIYGLVQDCSTSIANVLEILQSCTKPSICNTCLFSVLFILQFVLDFLSYHSYYGCFQNISLYKILQNCIITPCFVATLLMNHYLNQCCPLGTHKIDWNFNSLALGDLKYNFQNVFFKLISWIDAMNNSCETVLRRMPQNPSDDKSTLVQVMASKPLPEPLLSKITVAIWRH